MSTPTATEERVVRGYDVVAMRVPIVYDTYGDHDRDGRIYTLAQHEPTLRRLARDFPDPFPDPATHPEALPKPHPLVRPLVLRARLGERVRVRLTNRLRHRVGIHAQGVGYDVRRADGGAVGDNPDSSVEPDGSRVYVWDCDEEGTFWFGDIADVRGQEDGGNARGLFGALVVEPAGATWTDPVTGEPLTDGLYADVHVPGEPSFREYVVAMHDETSNDNPARASRISTHEDNTWDESERDGHGTVSVAEHRRTKSDGPHAVDHSVMLLNYRTEPMGGRLEIYKRLMESGRIDPERDRIVGEEQHHSSWLFGDPATPVLRAYRGDRAKIRLLMAGVKETHVFHLHVHQWHAVPGDEDSPLLDSISIGPQQAFTIEPLGGAGSVQKAVGDVIFHCHLYPHFHSGMWGMWRVFDVWQDGDGRYPDGSPIAALRPLPGHEPPPRPTPQRPGWPTFMAGEYPQKSPRPPRTPLMPEDMGREPSDLERNAFVADPQPGEAFTKVAPADAPLRVYDLVVMEGHVGYHHSGGSRWDDDKGVFYVLKEQVDDAGGVAEFQRQLAAGTRTVEPIAIRANKGDVVQLSLTNALPPGEHPETDFDPKLPFQPECGLHVHLVKFDPLVSDGSSVGWNYLSGATTEDQGKEDYLAYNTWIFRWYCDEEFGTIFFHDHLLANERQRHGLFGAMIAEPEGAVWTDEAGDPLPNGNRAVVRLPDGTAWREQVLAVGDFVPLYRHRGDGRDSEPVNPPAIPGDLEDHGAMAFNYRCEPLRERPGDPADWFDSGVHGDPDTPILRAYPGERLRLRLYQGSHEEQHSFRVHGMRWNTWFTDPGSPPRDQQTLGISEAFTLRIDEPHGPGDYLWGLGTADDLWMGAWGLIRLHDAEQPDLPKLPGAFTAPPVPAFDATRARRYRVSAHDEPIRYSDRRADPLAARFHTDGLAEHEPLVLRCRVGEWVEIVLTNEMRKPLRDSSYDPRLSALDDPGDREISPRVSLHPSGPLRYDVRTCDGSNVGRNDDGTAAPSDAAGNRWQVDFNADGTIRDANAVVYRWYADTPGVVLLEDRADVRTHKHRGLIGALVVEAAAATPYDPVTGAERWVGEQAVIRQGDRRLRELVLLLQDGLRLYHEGDESQPVTDLEDEPGDAGQKGFNYRSAHLRPTDPSLTGTPPTPLLECAPGDAVRVHLAMATDRARNHTFQIHGHTWPMEQHVTTPRVGAIGALSVGSLRTVDFTAGRPGDYAYRSGVLRWHLSEGVWGLIRVRD